MKYYLLTTFICLSLLGYSQDKSSKINPIQTEVDHRNHYQIDYELKDYIFTNGDRSIVNELNFSDLETYRKDNLDVEIYDETINAIVILYSRQRISSIRKANGYNIDANSRQLQNN